MMERRVSSARVFGLAPGLFIVTLLFLGMPLDGSFPEPAGLLHVSKDTSAPLETINKKVMTAVVWGIIYILALISMLTITGFLTRVVKRNLTLICLITIVFISAIWSPYSGKVIFDGLQLVGALATCALAANYYKDNVSLLFKHASIALGVNLTFNLCMIILLPALTMHPGGRWAGVTGSANYLGALAFCCAWASLAWVYVEGVKKSLVVLLPMTVAIVHLIGSNSVTSILTTLVAVVLFIYFWLARRPAKWRVAKVMAFYLMTIAILLIAFVSGLNFWELVGRTEGASGRDVIWLAAIDLIQLKPILGYGFGSNTEILGALSWNTSFHNGYLDIGTKLGFVGLFIFLYLIYKSFCHLLGNKGFGSVGVVCGIFLVTYLFYNLTEAAVLGARNPIWVLFTIVILTISLRDNGYKIRNVC